MAPRIVRKHKVHPQTPVSGFTIFGVILIGAVLLAATIIIPGLTAYFLHVSPPATTPPTPPTSVPTKSPTTFHAFSVETVTNRLYPNNTDDSGVSTPSFGLWTTVSGDGSTVVCGAPFNTVSANNVGAAWIYTRDGSGHWVQTQKIMPTVIGGDTFGRPIAVSYDGSTIAVGGSNYNFNQGGVWVYTRAVNGTWVEQHAGPLNGSATVRNSYFGDSVAMTSDGNTILVGADGSGTIAGSVYVFTRAGDGTWSQVGGPITPITSSAGDGFGWTLAMNANGTKFTAANGQFPPNGKVWTFVRNSTGQYVDQGQILTGPDYFGDSICMDDAGDNIAVGADTNGYFNGTFSPYEWNGTAWVAVGPHPLFVQGSMFIGSSHCNFKADGSRIYAGFTPNETMLPSFAIFARRDSEANWTLQSTFSANLTITLPQTNAVWAATSANGSVVAISTSRSDVGNTGTDSGLWIYDMLY